MSHKIKEKDWWLLFNHLSKSKICLLYTSDAADDSLRVDLGGRRIIKKRSGTVFAC